MKISLLNERIAFEKNAVVVDKVGNHKNTWTEYFSCYAYAGSSSYKQKESEEAGVVSADESLVFSVRYCSELSDLTTTHYRIRFRGDVYNIQSIDHMNYQKKSLKITAKKED